MDNTEGSLCESAFLDVGGHDSELPIGSCSSSLPGIGPVLRADLLEVEEEVEGRDSFKRGRDGDMGEAQYFQCASCTASKTVLRILIYMNYTYYAHVYVLQGVCMYMYCACI